MKVILSIAQTTVGEAIRRRVLLVILFIALGILAIAPALQVLSARQERTVLLGLTLGVIQLASAVIAIVLTVYLLPNEIERRTIYTILSKPVLRYQFLLGKYLGAVAALAMMMASMTLVLIGVYAITQGVSDPAKLAEIAKPPLLYFFQMSLLAAVAMFFSTFVTALVNFFLSGGMFLAGSLFSTVFESLGEGKGANPLVKGVAYLINTILPNFSKFNVQNPLINPTQQIQNEAAYYIGAAGYGLLYIVALLIGGMLIFERREV